MHLEKTGSLHASGRCQGERNEKNAAGLLQWLSCPLSCAVYSKRSCLFRPNMEGVTPVTVALSRLSQDREDELRFRI